MTIRDIVILPDPRLHLVSEPIEIIDANINTLIDDMLETMYDARGIGLAAIQIGEAKRIAICDVAKTEEEQGNPMIFINPQITWISEEKSKYEEGCLSIPDYLEEIERPAACKVQYLNRHGESEEIHAEGLLATCLQHEIDHLNGLLIIDHISKLKRDRAVKKFAKAAKRDI